MKKPYIYHFNHLIILLGLLFLQVTIRTSAQSLPADCEDMKTIRAKGTYYSKVAPTGIGNTNTFANSPSNSKHAFNNEHNTVWYNFKVEYNGLLEFQIIPDSIKDDYDFLLYSDIGPNFCKDITSGVAVPVRTCISRNNPRMRSKTGLNSKSEQTMINSGPGESWVKLLDVRKGEELALVLDNCYENGGAHKIKFRYHLPLNITAGLMDENGKPIPDAVAFLEEDKTGIRQAQAISDENGKVTLKVHVIPGKKYDFIAKAANHFFTIERIVGKREITDITLDSVMIPKIERDKAFVLEGMNFMPNVTVFVEGAEKKLLHLLEVLNDHPKLKILIEGHANGAGSPVSYRERELDLSRRRAEKVYDFLVANGIKKSRLRHKGLGSTKMINPYATTLEAQKMNMRVEVRVYDY